ncbi:DUF6894 family protein [Methylobacterium persicinum]|uniref:DUF6894 domain-containing protein n=1 Tax=Methylobacterium persicinum TaxID=374426 RepID=A0ABU0HJ76_9HYPH|nr:catalase [Methylobacterium persicinum]MDQ0442373.1 hypothetical protein [Methylobacterium persicinum]GJE37168.1 hypothetical protein KHHGKMAE_1224 [Methylobacterium persicinum]
MRAFFNILIHGKVVPDHVGQDVADVDDIRSAASTVVRALVQRHGAEAQLLDASLLVSDPEGNELLRISFFEALYLPVAPVSEPGRLRSAVRPERPAAFFDVALKPMRRIAGAVSARVQAIAQV